MEKSEALLSVCFTFTAASGHKPFYACCSSSDLKAINESIANKQPVILKDSKTGFTYTYPYEVIVGVSSRPFEPKKGKKP